jgi:murein DD-endopeptidase MepM/ murein hydrolase activator NlpD
MKMQNSIVSNDELKTVSYSNDKTVASSINSNQVNNVEKVQNKVSKMPVEAKVTKINNTVSNTTNTTNTVNTTVNNTSTNVVETKEELKFVAPVSGEISKDFAKDTLIYSNTLEEWTTHLGIDIKAPKTTIVVAAEKGTVESIKNDPRFGLTVIIEHEDSYKTVYANLLTTEFVAEDEKVEKGQSIGTVGNSAVFEIADEPHLHFEMIKDGEYVDPKLFLK